MKSLDKIKSYFQKYTREDYFIERVLKIRKEIGIPEIGIPSPDKVELPIRDNPASFFGIKYAGDFYPTFPNKRSKIYQELLDPIPTIYNYPSTILFINYFILFNERIYGIFSTWINDAGKTVSLIDYRLDTLERLGICDCNVAVCENYMDTVSAVYPITVGISPYASQAQVIDLIKQRWDYIQYSFKELKKEGDIDYSEDDKTRIHKIRSRTDESIIVEDIVYKNRELSLKEICELVRTKTGIIMDQGEIGKYRDLAIQRRSQNLK